MSDNSFFHENYTGKKMLVLAPHPDDEINVAGNLIYSLTRQGTDVYVVFSTNGDFQTNAEIRVREAFKSLKILGVPKSNVIFMGYGDSYNTYEGMHISDVEEGYVESKSGHIETYCAYGVNEFAYRERNVHSKYNRRNFCKDLKGIIKKILADLIVCVDYDQHPDHRWLSLAFDEVMCQILKEADNEYYPQVLKRFAYATAFCSVDDIESRNLKHTLRPNECMTLNYLKDIIDFGNWKWSERVRVPIHPDVRTNYLIKRNPLVKAMLSHKSQFMALRAGRILNSDEVFFERRTDSITYKAKVEVSSGEKRYLNDFKYIGTKDIKNKYPLFDNYLWIPDSDDKEKQITLEWDQPQDISILKIYFGISDRKIYQITIKLDDGFCKTYGCDTFDVLNIDLVEQHFVKKISIVIEGSDNNAGISEVEIYSKTEQTKLLRPYMKLTLDENFLYDGFLDNENREYAFDVYKYGCSDEINIEIGDSAVINEGRLLINSNINQLRIRAISSDNCYDDITLTHNSIQDKYVSTCQVVDRLWIKKFKLYESLYRWKLYIRNDGFLKTIEKFLGKIKSF